MDVDNDNESNIETFEELIINKILLDAEKNALPPRTPDQNIHSNRRARYRRNKKRRLKTLIFNHDENEDIDLPDTHQLSEDQLNNLKSFFRPKSKGLKQKQQQQQTNQISLSHMTGKKRNRNLNSNFSVPAKKRKVSNGGTRTEIHKSRVISLRHIVI